MLYKSLKNQLTFMGIALTIIFALILGAFLYNYYLTKEINTRQDELTNLASVMSSYSDLAPAYIQEDGFLAEIPSISNCQLSRFLAEKIPRSDEVDHYSSIVLLHEEFHKSLNESNKLEVMQVSQKLNKALVQYNGYLIDTLGQMQKLRAQIIVLIALPGLVVIMSVFVLFYVRLQRVVQEQVIKPLRESLGVLSKYDLVDPTQKDEPMAILLATQRAARYIALDSFRRELYPFWNSVFTEEQLLKGSIDLLGESQLVSAAAFYLYNEEKQELRLAASYAFPTEGKTIISSGEGPIGEAVRKNKSILIEKPKLKINFGFDTLEPSFLGYYPIKMSRLYGVLALALPPEASREEVANMEIFSNQLAMVMDRVHQLVYLQQLTEELKDKTLSLNKELLYKDSILNSSADGIAILSVDGQIKLFSKGAEEITGYSWEEAVGSNCCNIFSHMGEKLNILCHTGFCANQFLGNNKAAISGKELYITNKAGKLVPILFSAAPLYNDAGEVIEILQIFKDVTDLKITLTQLEEANHSKTEFLTTMSHELRTPLNAVLGFAELLELESFGSLNEKQKKYTANILTAGKHLLSLINDLLDISRIESGKMEWELGPIDIPHLFRGVISLLREKATQTQLNLTLEIEEGFQSFVGDERKMKQILFNLVNNGIKFTPPGGQVGVKVIKQGEGMEVTVWDTGIGIPLAEKDAIFEPFFRVDNGVVKSQQGTGLGLPLVKKMVNLPGGKIWLEEGKAGGTIFKVYLPNGN